MKAAVIALCMLMSQVVASKTYGAGIPNSECNQTPVSNTNVGGVAECAATCDAHSSFTIFIATAWGGGEVISCHCYDACDLHSTGAYPYTHYVYDTSSGL